MKGLLSRYRIHWGIIWRDKERPMRQKIAGSWRMFGRVVLRGMLAKIPRLVWPMDECEVLVAFDLSKVTHEQLFKVESALRELGVTFDTGSGCGKRDWEWDWSLHGPVTVQFYRKKKGNRRKADAC